MSNFVLMLTRDDVTVADAETDLNTALETDVRHIGFKDVGLELPAMRALVRTIKGAGRRAHLEVVSLTEAGEHRSIQIAIDLGVDYLLGGTRWALGAELLKGTGIRYFPYAGEVSGHPGTLDGSAESIVAHISSMAGSVDGVNLLAYRHKSIDGGELTAAVSAKSAVPVLVAGSIDSVARVQLVTEAGAWGFTVGAAALDLKFVPGQPLGAQLDAIVAAAGPQEID